MSKLYIKDILELDVRNLASRQYSALREHAIEMLRTVISYIEDEDYESLEKLHISDSPSGDGNGIDASFIDFAITDDSVEGNSIQDVIDKLKQLDKQRR